MNNKTILWILGIIILIIILNSLGFIHLFSISDGSNAIAIAGSGGGGYAP